MAKIPEVTYKNHLEHWIGGRHMATDRLSKNEGGIVKLGRCEREPFSLREECYATARLIVEQYGPIKIFLSGGLDSDIVVRSFLDQGLPVEVHTIAYSDNINEYDVRYAKMLCEEYRVKLHLHDFDIIDFCLSGAAVDFGVEMRCSQIAYLQLLWHARMLGGVFVMGGEILLQKDIDLDHFLETAERVDKWYFAFRENQDLAIYRYSCKTGQLVIDEFFSYTPEQTLAFCEDIIVKEVVSGERPCKLSILSSKPELYGKAFPELAPRKKAHGWEKIIRLNGEMMSIIDSKLEGGSGVTMTIEYNELLKQLVPHGR